MAIITLLTDFSEKDGYVGILKGVILTIAPNVRLVDLSHEIAAQAVLAGAYLLGRCAPYFPAGTIHLAVVDPGVGTARKGIAARLGSQFFVGPDNGLITLVYKNAVQQKQSIEIVELNRPQYWLKEVSPTFHGRDVFAPAAAHLANGVELKELGTGLKDPLLLPIPEAQRTDRGWSAEIIHIDAFGNLAASIGVRELGNELNFQVYFKGQIIGPLKQTFGAGKPGELIALLDSAGCLTLCVVNGNAAEALNARLGDALEIQFY